METMSNVLSMKRMEGRAGLEQHLASLRSDYLQPNISSLSSILLSPHLLRKTSCEFWEEKEERTEVEQEYHSASKPWILERRPTEDQRSTTSSSFSNTRRFSSSL